VRLTRFLAAQEGSFEGALAELRAGCKHGHWMWYIFPQLRGLGRTERAQFYGIKDLDEARAYLAHPVLGPRLADSAAAMLSHEGKTAAEILGEVDAMKLRSSATLFEAAEGDAAFATLLARYFGGERCVATLKVVR
jgi:uncharacterized protein (DUF1810 family)